MTITIAPPSAPTREPGMGHATPADGPTPMEVTPMPMTTWPQPIADDRGRYTTIPCRSNDPELWFAESPQDVEQAKALCGQCPVRAVCLAGALERREPWGVWGGQLLVQGAVVARKRPRGRPRKCEVAA